MSDIFLSYAHEDIERARYLADALKIRGWSVFWDHNIRPGETWDEFIRQALDKARCVVVIWSKDSIKSHWVREEAEEGWERKILVPIIFDNVIPPLGFRRIQCLDLSNWQLDIPVPELERLIESISAILESNWISRKRFRTEERFLDAAMPQQVVVSEATELLTMIRLPDSEGLRKILREQAEFQAQPEDVKTKPFEVNFPSDKARNPMSLDILINIETDDFIMPEKRKKIRIDASKDSEICF